MELNKIKAVVLDLDGTLLDRDHKLSAINKKTVIETGLTGRKIILASGRSFRSLTQFASELNISGPLVCYNGAAVYNYPSGEKLLG